MTALVSVMFQFPGALAPQARHVAVIGSFNHWNRAVHRLVKTVDGWWSIRICLPPGSYVYCFDVDGVPWLDPKDDRRVPNAWGSEYSVRDVHLPTKTSDSGFGIPIGGARARLRTVPVLHRESKP